MKRLFRSSKPSIDPLYPPAPEPDFLAQAPPPQPRRSMADMMGMSRDRERDDPRRTRGDETPPTREWDARDHKEHKHRSKGKNTVTPFPIDVGLGNDPAMSGKRASHRDVVVPSLGEMQAAQRAGTVDGYSPHMPSSHAPVQSPKRSAGSMGPPPIPAPPNGQRISRGYAPPRDGAPSPDGWTMVSQPPSRQSTGEQLPLPPSFGSSPQQISPQSPAYYLPPGARPPSPQHLSHPPPVTTSPKRHPQRSNTPATHPQNSARMSQSSLGHEEPLRTRDRGYSSASNSIRGSDQESSLGHAPPLPPPPANARLPKSSKSPLANAYDSSFTMPQPHPYAAAAPPPPTAEVAGLHLDEPTKEKKSFWGKKERTKKEVHEPPRPSVETYSSPDPAEDELHRGRFLGMDFGRREATPKEQLPQDVSSAIRTFAHATAADSAESLCGMVDPPLPTILDIATRINRSESADSVAVEAARRLRKTLQKGNEGERRAATAVWYVLMRNVETPSFHGTLTYGEAVGLEASLTRQLEQATRNLSLFWSLFCWLRPINRWCLCKPDAS